MQDNGDKLREFKFGVAMGTDSNVSRSYCLRFALAVAAICTPLASHADLGTRAFCATSKQSKTVNPCEATDSSGTADSTAAASYGFLKAFANGTDFSGEMLWRSNLKLPPSPEDAVKYLHIMGDRNPSPETVDLVTDGWAARQRGCTFSEWLSSRVFGSVEEVNTARKSLEKAFLIQSKISASSKR